MCIRDRYIIMPTNLVGAASLIKTLPKQDVYILDQTNSELKDYPSIHQNFVKDIYEALQKGKHLIDKYQKLILIFPGFREPLGMKIGFEKFCNDNHLNHEVINQFKERELQLSLIHI